MHVRRGFLNWGVFLICLGAVPLALQLGVIDRDTAASLLRLWPVVLVGIGLGLLLRFTRADALGGFVVAATLGLLVGVFFAGGFPFSATACTDSQPSGPSTARNGSADASFRLDVELTCGEMSVDRAPGAAWSVDVRAGDKTPLIEATTTLLRLRSANEGGFPFNADRRESWQVVLPTDSSVSANLTVNAGTLRAALGDGVLTDVNATYNAADGLLDLSSQAPATAPVVLNATANATSLSIVLPDGPLSGNLTINAASLQVCAPPAVGLRITYDETLSSNNFGAAGLAQSGKTWQSANYATATARADLNLSANVSSTTLNPVGGCQ